VPADRRPVVRAPDSAWKRLGELLQLRRAELGYRRRPAFTKDRDINIRLVTDIENAYRPNTFLTPTLGEIAQAYQVTYESLAAMLRGEADVLSAAEPAPLPAPSAPGSDSRRTSPEATADALAEVPAALREARNLTARIEQLLAASGDPAESEALTGYIARALRRVQIEVEELIEEAGRRAGERRAGLCQPGQGCPLPCGHAHRGRHPRWACARRRGQGAAQVWLAPPHRAPGRRRHRSSRIFRH
jgi:hypothetical protein